MRLELNFLFFFKIGIVSHVVDIHYWEHQPHNEAWWWQHHAVTAVFFCFVFLCQESLGVFSELNEWLMGSNFLGDSWQEVKLWWSFSVQDNKQAAETTVQRFQAKCVCAITWACTFRPGALLNHFQEYLYLKKKKKKDVCIHMFLWINVWTEYVSQRRFRV